MALSNNAAIEADDIILDADDPLPEVMTEELTLRDYDRRIIQAFLNKYNNSNQKVAEKLDISVSTIYRILKEGRNK